jgi:IS30 family transposase
MKHLSQARCTAIALKLNNRPRKRHGFLSPIEVSRTLSRSNFPLSLTAARSKQQSCD